MSVVFFALLIPQILFETTAVTSFVASWMFTNNFHEVDPGKFYRSAEMSQKDLNDTIGNYGIKTVIDLRWKPRTAQGAASEEKIVDDAGARYIHFPLKGSSEASYEKLQRLMQLYSEIERPVLVHCVSGTHRSGVASAIWLLSQESDAKESARTQLSARYGYFYLERKLKAFFKKRPTIDQVIWRFLEESDKTGVTLPEWTNRALQAGYRTNGENSERTHASATETIDRKGT